VFGPVELVKGYFGNQPAGSVAFTILIGAAMFALSLGVWALVAGAVSPLRRRLTRLIGTESAASRARPLVERLGPLFPYIVPGKEQERSRVSKLLICAGLQSPSALPFFYACKALLMLGLPLLVLLAAPFLPRVSTGKFMFVALVAAALGFVLPGVWLDRRVAKRQRLLRAAFPDALDLLVVCVEAGLGLAPALQRVADDLIISAPELGGELALVNAEMRAGVDRSQALKNLATRTGLDDIKGLVALLVQTMRFGTGVADALRVYSEEFRDKACRPRKKRRPRSAPRWCFRWCSASFRPFFSLRLVPRYCR